MPLKAHNKASDKTSGKTSGEKAPDMVSTGVSNGASKEITNGITQKSVNEATQEDTNGIATGTVNGATNNATNNAINGVANNAANKALHIFLLLRPKQWTKNLLLFAGLIFSLNLFQAKLICTSLLAFGSFCLLSSSAYIINDIIDIEEDKKHPRKKNRPLPAGKIGIGQALAVFFILLGLSLFLAWSLGLPFLTLSLIYFALCLAYSLWLKYAVILDVFTIAFGFLLRTAAGGVAIDVEISPWLLICTLLLALFLALTKRRQESINMGESGSRHRRVLALYPIPYLDQLISIVTAATILAYSLYTFTASRSPLYMLTIPFVIYGIFRYLYLVHNKKLGENPEEILLTDLPMIINILLWVLLTVFILYTDWLRIK